MVDWYREALPGQSESTRSRSDFGEHRFRFIQFLFSRLVRSCTLFFFFRRSVVNDGLRKIRAYRRQMHAGVSKLNEDIRRYERSLVQYQNWIEAEADLQGLLLSLIHLYTMSSMLTVIFPRPPHHYL